MKLWAEPLPPPRRCPRARRGLVDAARIDRLPLCSEDIHVEEGFSPGVLGWIVPLGLVRIFVSNGILGLRSRTDMYANDPGNERRVYEVLRESISSPEGMTCNPQLTPNGTAPLGAARSSGFVTGAVRSTQIAGSDDGRRASGPLLICDDDRIAWRCFRSPPALRASSALTRAGCSSCRVEGGPRCSACRSRADLPSRRHLMPAIRWGSAALLSEGQVSVARSLADRARDGPAHAGRRVTAGDSHRGHRVQGGLRIADIETSLVISTSTGSHAVMSTSSGRCIGRPCRDRPSSRGGEPARGPRMLPSSGVLGRCHPRACPEPDKTPEGPWCIGIPGVCRTSMPPPSRRACSPWDGRRRRTGRKSC